MRRFLKPGEVYDRLTILRRAKDNKRGRTQYLCQCRCGKRTVVLGWCLVGNETRSCGCLQRETRATNRLKHGDARHNRPTREWHTWQGMIQRCTNKHCANWKDYGGRGIKVCKRWRKSYANFLADMGRKPKGLTLHRKNNDGNYTPSNCKWATRSEQNSNQRRRTHCYKGHAFKNNEYRPPSRPGVRTCAICHKAWLTRYRARKKATGA